MFLGITSNVIIVLWLSRKRFIYEYKKVFIVTLIMSISNPVIGLILICFSKKNWSFALKMCFPLLPHYLSLVVLNQIDRIMINSFIGSSEAAIYSIAHSAGLLLILINDALNNAFVPWAYNKLKNNKSYEMR